jgi:hypothetical protein
MVRYGIIKSMIRDMIKLWRFGWEAAYARPAASPDTIPVG